MVADLGEREGDELGRAVSENSQDDKENNGIRVCCDMGAPEEGPEEVSEKQGVGMAKKDGGEKEEWENLPTKISQVGQGMKDQVVLGNITNKERDPSSRGNKIFQRRSPTGPLKAANLNRKKGKENQEGGKQQRAEGKRKRGRDMSEEDPPLKGAGGQTVMQDDLLGIELGESMWEFQRGAKKQCFTKLEKQCSSLDSPPDIGQISQGKREETEAVHSLIGKLVDWEFKRECFRP